MAGTAGLEPANAGIKTPCLNQLGHVPIAFIYFNHQRTIVCQIQVIDLPLPQGGHYIGILILL